MANVRLTDGEWGRLLREVNNYWVNNRWVNAYWEVLKTLMSAFDANRLEQDIKTFGGQIFAEVQNTKLSLFDPDFYTGKLMDWAMQDDAFKVSLFRFVDVLPALENSAAVIRHAQEYFAPVANRFPGILKWGFNVDPESLAAKLAAQLIKKQVRSMAERFILGETPAEALKPLRKIRRDGLAFTVDLLGEATLGERESRVYVDRYLSLLNGLAKEVKNWPESRPLVSGHVGEETPLNISVKLSALYSQSHPLNGARAIEALSNSLGEIIARARELDGFVYVDMEDTKLTSLTLDVFTRVLSSAEFKDFARCGCVLQAYLRRTSSDVERLVGWVKARGTPIAIRLVKGAYWDTETVLARQQAWAVPVWQEKSASDLSYERISLRLLENSPLIVPAFGSHNIRSLVHAVKVAEMLGVPKTHFELQALYGMAEPIKKAFVDRGYLVRDYAPVGELIPGMGYLVRRLLENTSNEGFLRRGFHDHEDADKLLASPRPTSKDSGTEHLTEYAKRPFANVSLIDFSEEPNREAFRAAISHLLDQLQKGPVTVKPIAGGAKLSGSKTIDSVSPENQNFILAKIHLATGQDAENALEQLHAYFPTWRDTPTADRVRVLRRAAQIMEQRRFELAATIVLEAGKPWIEADGDVAEAIDFLRYYAAQAEKLFTNTRLGDYPGEYNVLFYEPRGITSVICPWNFPLAIPCGMFAAALVTGNVAILKPSALTCLIALRMFEIFHDAGLPVEAAAFMPGPGSDVGETIVTSPLVSTIVFTGSKEVGLEIIRKAGQTHEKQEHVKRVIVEMGGKNAMIVDDDADLDEAVKGVLYSAFGFQGQKCSACSRAIILEDIYDKFVERLTDAVNSLIIGPATDSASFMGPVIDAAAQERLTSAITSFKRELKLCAQASLPPESAEGFFVPATVFEEVPEAHVILKEELFGPILAVLKAKDFDDALRLANDSAFGLTGAVYSRSPEHIEKAQREFRVGNLYINRGSTGALVMRQPFGGAKMSGVGSKAGGPDYLLQFVIPRAVSENTMRRGFAPQME